MQNRPRFFSHCILGSGYTARLASIYIQLFGGNPIIVSNSSEFAQLGLSVSNREITNLPIFPVRNSSLLSNLGYSLNGSHTDIRVSHRNSLVQNTLHNPASKGSFIEFLMNDPATTKWVNSSVKQWGKTVYKEPFTAIQQKIVNHYKRKEADRRIGFIEGVSPYHNILTSHRFSNTLLGPNEINIEERRLGSTG